MSEAAPSSRRDGLIALAIGGVVLGTVAIGALAPAHTPRVALAPKDDPACAEWSDGCRVCQRLAAGPACSLPGIACTPGGVSCTRRLSQR